MDEEEQFVNIDLNDDNICTICKLDTDTGTLSFCHVCFELNIEGECPCWRNGSFDSAKNNSTASVIFCTAKDGYSFIIYQ